MFNRFLPLLYFLLFPTLFFILLSGCNVFNPDAFSEKKIVLESNGKKINLTVEIADNEKTRSKGLMERKQLEDGRGMWFVFEDEKERHFWMKNTKIPLDIIFFDNEKKVVSFVENMEPCIMVSCPLYSSKYPAQYALEVHAGFIKTKKVDVGDMVL